MTDIQLDIQEFILIDIDNVCLNQNSREFCTSLAPCGQLWDAGQLVEKLIRVQDTIPEHQLRLSDIPWCVSNPTFQVSNTKTIYIVVPETRQITSRSGIISFAIGHLNSTNILKVNVMSQKLGKKVKAPHTKKQTKHPSFTRINPHAQGHGRRCLHSTRRKLLGDHQRGHQRDL
jgi:hypothetical protein